MKNIMLKKRAASLAAAAMMTVTAAGTVGTAMNVFLGDTAITAVAAESSVKILSSAGYGEGVYATWSSVTGASGYNVYVDGDAIAAGIRRVGILPADRNRRQDSIRLRLETERVACDTRRESGVLHGFL